MDIKAGMMHFEYLNRLVRESEDKYIKIEDCNGQRYIGSALSGKEIVIEGTPGNALGCYLDGCEIHVYGNAQDATGDTMNDGTIYVHGSTGDAAGYAMRGGRIIIKNNSGYRTGIHMKAYKEKIPVIVIGGSAGSFLGEYQAGGYIVVLGLNLKNNEHIVGNFCGTGMHGGKIYLRCDKKDLPNNLPRQVIVSEATDEDMQAIKTDLEDYCKAFDISLDEILSKKFIVLSPDTKNPYKQLYTYS